MGTQRRSAWRHAVPVALAIAGLLFATGSNSARTDVDGGRQEELSGLVSQENRKVDSYDKQVERMQREVDRASRARARNDEVAARAQERADELGEAVGLRPAKGAGVRVTLDDAPRTDVGEGNVPPDYLVVHQQDVQAVVNAMWAGGATAVQVMDQRLISTSAVRCVGNTLLLNGRVYSPPFAVTAVGPTDEIVDSLEREPGIRVYKQYVKTYGLGYEVERITEVTVPGYRGTLDLQFAESGR